MPIITDGIMSTNRAVAANLRVMVAMFCCLLAVSVVGCLPGGLNSPPEIKVIEYPQDIDVDTDVKLVCHASDADGDVLAYQWQCDYGKIIGGGAEVTWHSPDETGMYIIRVTIKDWRGAAISRDISMQVIDSSYLEPATNLVINLQDWDGEDELILKTVWVRPAAEIAINVINVEGIRDAHVTYTWSTNGGRIVGPGLKEQKADRVGWYSPGVPGTYNVILVINRQSGEPLKYVVEFGVKNPHCCE